MIKDKIRLDIKSSITRPTNNIIDNLSKEISKIAAQAFDDGFKLGLKYKEVKGEILPRDEE